MINKIFNFRIKNIAWAFLLAIFFLVDRYLKFLALSYWPGAPKKIIGNLLTFDFTPNYNIAFSLPLSGIWLNVLITSIITAIFVYLLINKRHLSKLEIISFSGIIVGATSNLMDRIKYGYVVDYFDLSWFTVFNLADTLISLSTIILFIHLIRPPKKNPIA